VLVLVLVLVLDLGPRIESAEDCAHSPSTWQATQVRAGTERSCVSVGAIGGG
jgi:hypothetical protein